MILTTLNVSDSYHKINRGNLGTVVLKMGFRAVIKVITAL